VSAKILFLNFYYSNLRASIGCNSAAFFAGQIPDTIQIMNVRVVARTTTSVVIDTLIHSISKLFTSCIASQDRIIAITHPIAVTTTDSIKNCVIISLFNAQIAFLIQISLVLSVTDTSIIFITQIHPTSKEIEPIAASKYVKIDIALSIASPIADNEERENHAKSI
jgi:hypothetical protein